MYKWRFVCFWGLLIMGHWSIEMLHQTTKKPKDPVRCAITSATNFEWKQAAADSHAVVCVCIKRVCEHCNCSVYQPYTVKNDMCKGMNVHKMCVSACVCLKQNRNRHGIATKRKIIVYKWNIYTPKLHPIHIFTVRISGCIQMCATPEMTMCVCKIFSYLANWIF